MADVWVVNASPLIALAHAGTLELLEKLPGALVVPEAVVEEILAGPDDPARRALASGWGPRRAATVPEKVAEWGLGKGESGVLALALALGATAVLDDRAARRGAKALGVPVIGTFGVIIRAGSTGCSRLPSRSSGRWWMPGSTTMMTPSGRCSRVSASAGPDSARGRVRSCGRRRPGSRLARARPGCRPGRSRRGAGRGPRPGRGGPRRPG